MPYDLHDAACTGPFGGRTTWVDYGPTDAGDGGTSYDYWVRAIDSDGFRSSTSGPVTLSVGE